MAVVTRQLPLELAALPVEPQVIERLDCFSAAIKLSVSVSGLQDKLIAAELEIPPANWSGMKSGQRHFPPDKLTRLMQITGNQIPLIWLARQCGYDLVRQESPLEQENRQLKDALAERERELEITLRTAQAITGGGHARG